MYEQIMFVLEPFHLFPRIGLWVRSSANISIRPRLKAGEKLPFDRLVLQLQVKHPSTSGLPRGTSDLWILGDPKKWRTSPQTMGEIFQLKNWRLSGHNGDVIKKGRL
jgi:hypothetical protein